MVFALPFKVKVPPPLAAPLVLIVIVALLGVGILGVPVSLAYGIVPELVITVVPLT